MLNYSDDWMLHFNINRVIKRSEDKLVLCIIKLPFEKTRSIEPDVAGITKICIFPNLDRCPVHSSAQNFKYQSCTTPVLVHCKSSTCPVLSSTNTSAQIFVKYQYYFSTQYHYRPEPSTIQFSCTQSTSVLGTGTGVLISILSISPVLGKISKVNYLSNGQKIRIVKI